MNIDSLKAGNIIKELRRVISPLGNNLHFLIYPLIYIPSIATFVLLLRKIIQYLQSINEQPLFLELTPPALTEKTAYTTQQLFSVIHTLGLQKTMLDRLLGIKAIFSFEIVSTKTTGIRYLVKTSANNASNLKRTIVAYLPQVEVHPVNDYVPADTALKGQQGKVVDFRLKNHFAYPLQKQNVLQESDPVAYITGMMTKLSPGELIALQLVLTPTKRQEVRKLSQMILRNEDVLQLLDRWQIPRYFAPLSFLMQLMGKVFWGIDHQVQWALTELTSSASNRVSDGYLVSSALNQMQSPATPARVLSTFETQAIQSIQEKLDQPLFETSLRVLAVMNNKGDQKERVSGFMSSLATFSVPQYQSFVIQNNLPVLLDKIRLFSFTKRLHSAFFTTSSSLLSVSEIADLYHFPYSRSTKTENIVKVYAKQLPAPLSLKNNSKLDVVFAKNTYGGQTTMIGLTREERIRHMYLIGATGTGKSTLLLSMINQDLNSGKGICVVDPHGDLAEAAITCIPESRKVDFIYFNPFDIAYPLGINLLELTPGLNEDEALLEKEYIAESVISLFRKVFSDTTNSHPHRIEYILRNTIHTAFTLEKPTLFTIFELLNNPAFQKKAIAGLTDENLKNFWKYEIGKAGDFQRVKMIAPITARIGRFLFSPSAKRILEQAKSTIDFDDILNSKKIMICNLAKGNIGEDTSEVLGIMILNKIQLAALKRGRMKQAKRRPYYLYVDEFQNFATPSFVQMLSEARKYGLSLIMAEQSTSQQKDKQLTQIVLANTGTVVSFRSANPQDEDILLPQFRPYIDSGEIANLPAFHFYIKKAALSPEEPFSGTTIMTKTKTNSNKIHTLIESSRQMYAKQFIPEPKKDSPSLPLSTTNDSSNRQLVPAKKPLLPI